MFYTIHTHTKQVSWMFVYIYNVPTVQRRDQWRSLKILLGAQKIFLIINFTYKRSPFVGSVYFSYNYIDPKGTMN